MLRTELGYAEADVKNNNNNEGKQKHVCQKLSAAAWIPLTNCAVADNKQAIAQSKRADKVKESSTLLGDQPLKPLEASQQQFLLHTFGPTA